MSRNWPSDLKVHVVSHTHWDREWRLPIDFFQLKLQRCLDHLFEIMEADPSYRAFLLDGQAVMVEDYLEGRPERAALFESYVREGRLQVGPWYTLVDNNLIDGESIVRNLLTGTRLAARRGGVMREGYLISSFGHCGQMPQIFAGFGIGSILFSRGISEWQVPSEFLWQAPDGTLALALHLPDRYTKSNWYYLVHRPGVLGRDGLDWKYRWPADFPVHACDRDSADNYWFRCDERLDGNEAAWVRCAETLVEKGLAHSTVPILLAMDGVDHLFPTGTTPRIIEAVNRRFGREIFVHSTLPAYVADVRAYIESNAVDLERREGEMRRPIKVPAFNQLLAGTVSARMPMKLMNYAAETALIRVAEPLATLAWLAGSEYPARFLDGAWRRLMQNHAHDGICGTSIDAVHEDMVYRFGRARRTGGVLAERALQVLVGRIDTSSFGEPSMALTVFNPGAARSSAVVRAVIDVPAEWESDGIALRDREGGEVPCQIFSKQRQEREILADHDAQLGFLCMRYEIEFLVEDLPSFGYRTFRVVPASWKVERPSLVVGPAAVENEFLRVEVASDGSVVVTDRRSGERYEGLMVFADGGDIGDSTTFVPPMGDATFLSTGSPSVVSVSHAGMLRATLEIRTEFRIPARCEPPRKPVELVETAQPFKAHRSGELVAVPIRSEITIERGSRRVEIRTEIENTARDHRLRVLFPTGCREATEWFADAPFDVVERSIELPDTREWVEQWPETQPCRGLTGVSDGRRGLAVLPKGIPEAACIDDESRTLALTLLRCTRRSIGENYDEEGSQCLGRHVFEYALVPFSGTWEEAGLVAESAEYRTPLRAALFAAGRKGDLPLQRSFLELRADSGSVTVSAFKRSEDGSGCVLRLVNAGAGSAAVSIGLAPLFGKATAVRLDETPADGPEILVRDGRAEVELGPKRIVTLLLEPLAVRP